MRNRQTITKIWFLVFLSLTLIFICVAVGIGFKTEIIIVFDAIIIFGALSLYLFHLLGHGNLENPFSLNRGRVYKILESHQMTSHNIESEKRYIARVENERHQKLWFEFEGELPPQYFTLTKEDGKKKFIPAADW